MTWLLAVALAMSTALIAQTESSTISGRVQDITGAVVAGVHAQLRADNEDRVLSSTMTDALGAFVFRNLREGWYALRLMSPGFQWLTVRSIYVTENEQKTLPALELSVGNVASCGGRAVLDYIRLFEPTAVGNIGGTIRVDLGPLVGNSPAVKDADVVLLCGGSTPCARTRTNAGGFFHFGKVPAGAHAIRVSHAGFYAEMLPGYIAQDGRELIYFPLYIERCFRGDCDPAKRPKKPLAICE